ncbi:hypothetical protein GGS20DRAFT_569975 [Poronia punctata]|nr:hypothetical protein GGS20DRAFT_569975 [Poronia punctata]
MESNTQFLTYQPEAPLARTRKGVTTGAELTILHARKLSLRTNFSYSRHSHHEPNESRSSNGSILGMTDASDSELSFDDDSVYNTSASELWDSFWPDRPASSAQEQAQDSAVPEVGHRDYKRTNPAQHSPSQKGGDTIRTSLDERKTEADEPASPHTIRTPQRKLASPRSPVAYSIYPKPPVVNVHRQPHPPRTSSLSVEVEPSSPTRRQGFLRGSKSNAGLRPTKNVHGLFIAPSLPPHDTTLLSPTRASKTVPHTAYSVPVSPAYPPSQVSEALRPSASAINLREGKNGQGQTGNASRLSPRRVRAPLTNLLPSALPEPHPQPPRPQVERFVSVFEFDSDSESEAEVVDEAHNSFARRIARGLHKKSASEKRASTEKKSVAAGLAAAFASSDVPNKQSDSRPRERGSLGRRRGGSLGRIFGLMGR